MKPCPICSSDKMLLWMHPRRKTVYYCCSKCEAIVMDSMFYPTHDIELEKYLEHENELSNQGYVNFLENFIDAAVKPHLSEGYILDVGSGPNPVLAHLLKNRGYQVDIYDPFFHQNLDENKHYDMVTATEVVEHFHHPMDSFQWMIDRIKPGGFLSIMTLFHHNDMNHFQEWFYQRDPTHVIFYRPKTLMIIAERFDLVFVEHNDYRYAVFKKRMEL